MGEIDREVERLHAELLVLLRSPDPADAVRKWLLDRHNKSISAAAVTIATILELPLTKKLEG